MIASINTETCKRCGLCSQICPAKIYTKTESGEIKVDTDRADVCLKCGQCMAICETQSIKIEGLSYEKDLFEIPENSVNYDIFYNFLATRRSVRNFKNKPVEKEVIQKIIDAISLAPYGALPNNVEITVVQNRQVIEKALPFMEEFINNCDKWFSNPISHLMIKRRLSVERYNTIINHLLPRIRKGQYKIAQRGDTITRNAPALLIFHADKGAEEHTEDALIYLTYALLAAHSLGLGATVIGLVPPPINKIKELKDIFNIPENNEAIIAMIIGYPQYKFKKGIKRPRTKIHWL